MRPATLWTYAKLLLRGRRLQDSNGNVLQLGGDIWNFIHAVTCICTTLGNHLPTVLKSSPSSTSFVTRKADGRCQYLPHRKKTDHKRVRRLLVTFLNSRQDFCNVARCRIVVRQ